VCEGKNLESETDNPDCETENLAWKTDNLVWQRQNLTALTAHPDRASDNLEGAYTTLPNCSHTVTICLHGNFNQIHRRKRKRIFSEISAEENA
jgi:hypothetical protein